MSGESVGPVEVGTHAGDDAHAALFSGGCAFAEEVAAVEEFSVLVERDLRRVVGENAGDADEDDVGAGVMPEVGPLLDVHDGGIVLGHVGLADAADALLPGKAGAIERREASGERDEVRRGLFACGLRGEQVLGAEGGGERESGGGLEEAAAVEHGRSPPGSTAQVYRGAERENQGSHGRRRVFRRGAPAGISYTGTTIA